MFLIWEHKCSPLTVFPKDIPTVPLLFQKPYRFAGKPPELMQVCVYPKTLKMPAS